MSELKQRLNEMNEWFEFEVWLWKHIQFDMLRRIELKSKNFMWIEDYKCSFSKYIHSKMEWLTFFLLTRFEYVKNTIHIYLGTIIKYLLLVTVFICKKYASSMTPVYS